MFFLYSDFALPFDPCDGVMGGGPILEFDNVKPLTGKKCKIRDRMEIICS